MPIVIHSPVLSDKRIRTTDRGTAEVLLEQMVMTELSHLGPAVADLDPAADLATTVAKVNELLEALRQAALIATE